MSEALKGLGIFSTLLDGSNSDEIIALKVTSRNQLELRSRKEKEFRQSDISSYFGRKWSLRMVALQRRGVVV